MDDSSLSKSNEINFKKVCKSGIFPIPNARRLFLFDIFLATSLLLLCCVFSKKVNFFMGDVVLGNIKML